MRYMAAIAVALGLLGCGRETPRPLTSPDGRIDVKVFVSGEKATAYSVNHGGRPVILESGLGLQLTGADFTRDVRIAERSPITPVNDSYRLRGGKKSRIMYRANEQTFSVVNRKQQELSVTFRVSNDGVAFRYSVAGPDIEKRFVKETSSFRFAPEARAWLQPVAPAQTGWNNVNPSYEEHYQMDIPVGTPSTLGAGWVFPALFKTGDTFALISEAGMDGSWHASRLHHDSDNGEYELDVPQAPEVFTGGDLLAGAGGELISPWRIIAIGDLAALMESTLGTDLAAPAVVEPTADFIEPGHASWSWAILKDDFTTFEVQKQFVDYAADMHWDYTLVDADWDRKIGYDKLAELVDYAAERNVGILVWFNSSGDWNKTPYTPKSELLTRQQRTAVFSRLHDIGVKGVKIDFFAGDGRSMIAYYVDILKDAAEHNLLVNFHGATLPRGWQRTWPNLMTVEAVRGFEFGTFSQEDQDRIATQAVMSLFTRNVFDPMDFTPMVFGDIPDIERATENSFELAQSVLMTSGIQHFAAIPAGMATAPDYVKDFLRELPREWDDVKFIDGHPGRYVALARRAGEAWYVAGLNAEEKTRTLTLDLGFAGDKEGTLIGSGETARAFSKRQIDSGVPQEVILRPNSGFVLILK